MCAGGSTNITTKCASLCASSVTVWLPACQLPHTRPETADKRHVDSRERRTARTPERECTVRTAAPPRPAPGPACFIQYRIVDHHGRSLSHSPGPARGSSVHRMKQPASAQVSCIIRSARTIPSKIEVNYFCQREWSVHAPTAPAPHSHTAPRASVKDLPVHVF